MPDDQKQDKNVFDENMSHLLRHAAEPPRLDPERKVQMLDELKTRFSQMPAKGTKGRTLMSRLTHYAAYGAAAAALIAVAWFAFSPSGPELDPWKVTPDVASTKRLDDGTVLYLKGQARYAVTGKRHIRLDSGQVLLFVAKSDKPFVVETPHGRAEARARSSPSPPRPTRRSSPWDRALST